MKFSNKLKNSCSDIWIKAHKEHPFVKSIGDGTLSLEHFQNFMKQDYFFLIQYCKVISLAISKSSNLEVMSKWSELLNETLNVEMDLHRSFCKDFGITSKDLELTIPTSQTLTYTDYLLKTASLGNADEIAVSLLPCQWGYDEIGRMFSNLSNLDSNSFHARWIKGYNSSEYQEMTIWLKNYVDNIEVQLTDEMKINMKRIFYLSTRHELMFWDSVWYI